jgi:putative tricarboxylic transport membrane protein
MQRLLRTGDFWAGLAFAALGAYIVSEARGWVYLAEDGPGAGFFPLWYGVAMLVLSFALVVGAARKTNPGDAMPATESVAVDGVRPRGASSWKDTGRALACWAALGVSVALLNLVGFIVSFTLLSWFIVTILCGKRPGFALAISVGYAVLFWVVFSWGLDMGLPSGKLF